MSISKANTFQKTNIQKEVKRLLTYKEAKHLVLERAKPLGVIEKPLLDALGLVLAENVVSHVDIPPFDNSAMDGYAVKYADIEGAHSGNPIPLKVVGEVPAGEPFLKTVASGTAVTIFTGAPVPDSVDTVVPVEFTEKGDGIIYVKEAVAKGSNIRPKGEDVRANEVLFKKWTRVTPEVIGVLASIGKAHIKVYKKPTVGILSTGSELIRIDEPYSLGKIRDSNTYLLGALSSELPVNIFNFGITKDDPEQLEKVLKEALGLVDILITTGGVSVGDYDLVKEILKKVGAERIFWKVAQKPGHPLAFYSLKEKVIFGLPGNPAAVQICFHEYVRPFILKSLGYLHYEPITLFVPLKNGYKKKPGRLNFIRVALSYSEGELIAIKAGAQGSGVLSTSARANAIALIPEEIKEISEKDLVEIHYFDSLSWPGFEIGENNA